jgi:multidrug efflux pump subunit AcrB
MWIVRLALRRPYTFVVMSILILIMGGLAIVRTPTDIFPTIDITVVSIIWNYSGLVPQDMADRIVIITERNLTTTVDNKPWAVDGIDRVCRNDRNAAASSRAAWAQTKTLL